jgi:hypothetical protein
MASERSADPRRERNNRQRRNLAVIRLVRRDSVPGSDAHRDPAADV